MKNSFKLIDMVLAFEGGALLALAYGYCKNKKLNKCLAETTDALKMTTDVIKHMNEKEEEE